MSRDSFGQVQVWRKATNECKQCLCWYFVSCMNNLWYWCIYRVKAFDSIDLKLFKDFGKTFDNVAIIEKYLTVSIYWFILAL